MRTGFRSSEFWVVSLWSGKAALTVAALLSLHRLTIWDRLTILPAACLLVWCASVIANNYIENRFRLKAQAASQGKPAEPCGQIGFVGGHPESQNEEEDNERH